MIDNLPRRRVHCCRQSGGREHAGDDEDGTPDGVPDGIVGHGRAGAGHRTDQRPRGRRLGRCAARRHDRSHQHGHRRRAHGGDRRRRALHGAAAPTRCLRCQRLVDRLPGGPAGRRPRHRDRDLARRLPDGSRAGQRDRDRDRAGQPGRDGQRHPRHRHRRAAGGRPAAQRPQLHPTRHAHPWRGGATHRPRRAGRRCDAGRLRQRHRGLQRQRHAQPVEQLPARRRHQQRHLQHRLRAAAAPRRHPGVQDPDPRLRGRVRPQRRVGRERRDQVGQQHLLGRGLGVQSRRQAAGAQLLRAREPAQAGAEAEPVRRRARRSGRQEPAVRVRLLRGLPQRRRHHQQRAGAVGSAAGRQLRRDDHPRSADRPAVPEQHDSRRPHQPGRHAPAERVRAAAERSRQPLHRLADRQRRA